MTLAKRCVCGHIHTTHTARGACYLCPCTGFHRRVAAVRLSGPPPLDLCRKTDYTGELK